MHIDRAHYDAYVDHAFEINEHEEALREALLPQIPEVITDSHTHAIAPVLHDPADIPEHIQRHMMSTFPGFTIDKSREVDDLLFPGKEVSKARFSHIFPNIDKRVTNDYLARNSSKKDIPVLFGISDTPNDIDYTIAELESGAYRGLKMYYLATEPPKYTLYEYFPEPILAAAEKVEAPIVLHLPHSLYNSEDEVHKAAEDFPGLKIILAHVGVANVPKDGIDGILHRFAQHPNIYADTALVDVQDIVLKALQHFGTRRVLYGSDEPLNLMRTMTYFNPDLQAARVLTDYDYHWADATEQQKYKHLAEKPFVHNHWLQIQALLGSLSLVSTSVDLAKNAENVFNNNARRVYGV